MEPRVEQVTSTCLGLGEGPHWDAENQLLYYLDIPEKTVHRYDPKTKRETKGKLEKATHFLIPIEGKKDRFVAGQGLNIVDLKWDGESENVEVTEILGETKIGFSLNDGKADPFGRIYTGTVPHIESLDNVEENTCAIYMLDRSETKELVKNVTLSNGLAWDIDRRIFYHVDSLPKIVYAYDYDPTNGQIDNKKAAINFTELGIEGFPDGMTIDTDGNLWVACFSGHQVIKVDPSQGKVLQKVKLPVKNVTSVAFGGKNLDELYVTSAGMEMFNETLTSPNGALFVVKNLGVKGLAAKSYKLK